MRSWRLLFSACLVFGLSLFATLSTPASAYAEWEDVGSPSAYCVTNISNSSFSASSLKISPIVTTGSVNSLLPYNSSAEVNSPSGLSSSTVIWFMMPVSGGNIQSGKKFRINLEGFQPFYACYANGISNATYVWLSPVNLKYWVRTSGGTFKNVTAGSDGLFKADSTVTHVFVSFTSANSANANGLQYVELNFSGPRVQVPDGEPTVEGYIQDQTEELKSTDGSSGIVNGMSNQGQSISQNLNFVQQTGQFVTAAFDAVANADAAEGIYFPGLTIMGNEILAAQTVPFLGYLGADLEQQIRNFVTMVLFLAWVMGLRSIYRKIFLGESEVEVVDDE